MQNHNNLARYFANNVTFDRNEIRKKIIMPTFNQARRYVNIYEALIKEFHEGGCPTSGKYFQHLMDKEHLLYENASIRDRFLDEPNLLLGLFDSCKMAEKVILSGQYNGPEVCSRLLLQCILTLKKYEKKYEWILEDVFNIIIRICEKVCRREDISKESLCRIYYKYALFLRKSDLEKAINYLEKSFDLTKGTTWMYNENDVDGKSQPFSSIIANEFAHTLLEYANNIFHSNPCNAINETRKAVIIITGDGIEHNKTMYIKAYLNMSDFQIKVMNYEASLATLEHVVEYIRPHIQHKNTEFLKFLSRYYHLKGICYEGLKKNDVALSSLYKSLQIAQQFQLRPEEANILLDIAKMYTECGRSQYRIAKNCLRQSKDIFIELNDMFNIKKTSYRLGKLKAQNIQPMILDLIKLSSINYCDRDRLIRWKSMCLPFWRDLHLNWEKEESNSIECLLRTTIVKEKDNKNSSFQREPSKG